MAVNKHIYQYLLLIDVFTALHITRNLVYQNNEQQF